MQPAVLPGFLQSLGPLITRHGYLAVGGVLFLEAFAIPVPGETVLLTAAIYAGAGRLNIVVVIVVGTIATFLGSFVGYFIGRTGGRVLVTRYGRFVGLNERRFASAEAFFERQGPKIIVLARFVEGLRQANGILAGTSGMAWKRFFVFNAIGAVVWVTTWALVGDLAGSHVGVIYDGIVRYFWVALGVVVLALVALVIRHLRHRADLEATPEQLVEQPAE
ncbi:MAG TPA: DedA family protein [Acidimicrobiales bacterium]